MRDASLSMDTSETRPLEILTKLGLVASSENIREHYVSEHCVSEHVRQRLSG